MRIEVEIGFSFKRSLDGAYRWLDLPETADVDAAIRAWADRYPHVKPRLLNEDGEIRRNVNALINGENVTLRDGFGTALEAGDRLTLLPPVGGG